MESSIDRLVYVGLLLLFPFMLISLLLFLPSDTDESNKTQDVESSSLVMEAQLTEESKEPLAEEKTSVEETATDFTELFSSLFDLLVNFIIIVILCLLAFVALFLLYNLFSILSEKYNLSDKRDLIALQLLFLRFKAPKQLRPYLLFIRKHSQKLPKEFSEPYPVLLKAIKEDNKSLQYASLAYIEPEFINGFSKLKTVVENKEYLDSFLEGYFDNDEVIEQTIIKPLDKSLNNFLARQENFDDVVTSTKKNDLYSLLGQDFSKIETYQK